MQKGIKQGCILSPMLFNIYLNMDKAIGKKNGISWSYFQVTRLTDLEYAEDICLISRSIEDIGKMLQNLEEHAMKCTENS